MKKTIAFALLALLILTACTKSIAEIKKDENVGEKVSVAGTVQSTIKLGQLSGYTIKDENGDTIGVSSKSLPAEGAQMTVTGTLMKDTLLGWYIKAQE
jgi:hypothetical protein